MTDVSTGVQEFVETSFEVGVQFIFILRWPSEDLCAKHWDRSRPNTSCNINAFWTYRPPRFELTDDPTLLSIGHVVQHVRVGLAGGKEGRRSDQSRTVNYITIGHVSDMTYSASLNHAAFRRVIPQPLSHRHTRTLHP